jgi:cytochrome c-type biogenesis protein CcmE
MSTRRQRRGLLVGGALLLAGLAVALVMNAFRSNLVFFVTPTQIARGEAATREALRVGGLVQAGSVQRDDGSLAVRFVLTDQAHSVPVRYAGVLPDLFAAGKGAIAQGRLDADGTLVATEVLAKHDENYMPPEVHDAMKQAQAQAQATTGATR